MLTGLLIIAGAAFVALTLYLLNRGWQEENGLYKTSNQNFKTLVCYKGGKDYWINGWLPHIPHFWKKKSQFAWQVKFTEESHYDLQSIDQRDWNKGGGITFNYLNHLIDAAMWGFRKNLDTNKYELCAYCHVDSKRIIPTVKSGVIYQDKEIALELPENTVGLINLMIDWDNKKYKFSFTDGIVVNYFEVPFNHSLVNQKEITCNFGGNRKSPNKHKINWIRL